MPRTDEKRLPWLQNFSAKLPTYKTKYGIADADVTKVSDILIAFIYWINYLIIFNEFISGATAYKNELVSGVDAGSPPSVIPVIPDPGHAPTPVEPGAFAWISKLANTIKNHPAYTLADGEALGLEGAEDTAVLPDKPAITVRRADGNHPEIVWKKLGMDAIGIYVKRGNATEWQFLAMDTVPNYIDTFPLPATGESAIWR